MPRLISAFLIVALFGLTVAPLGAIAEDAPSIPDVSVTTGDAAALSETGTQANTNIVDTEPVADSVPAEETTETEQTTVETETTPEANTAANATSETTTTEENPVATTATEGESHGGGFGGHHQGEPDATASSTLELVNDVDADNQVETVAETGDNVASTTKGTAEITTGNAFAFANIINVLNTNIIDSYGFLLFLSALFGNGNIDLRGLDFRGGGPIVQDNATPCDLENCAGAEVNNLGVSNTASINNSVIVRADTGGNTAEGTNASITTGDAIAGANIVNVANTNIINSNYLLLAVNQIGNYSGDIVLPGFNFFEWFLKGAGAGYTTNTDITNTAEVNNNVSVTADTGNNTATSTRGTAEIETGDATAASSVSNVVNNNMIGGGAPVYILLNIMGNWTGQIFGLPQGLLWQQTPSGIVIYSEQNGGLAGDGSTTLNNTAKINNNVEVFALTGDNKVDARRGASITTGDAYAATNIFNLVNTNIVGRNLMFAVLNIMGDWSGNLSFGMPDLFVGAQFESQHSPLVPGSPFTYKILVKNNGDLPATNVVIDNLFDTKFIGFQGNLPWNIGTLGVGEVRELMVTGIIASEMNYGEFPSTIKTTAFLTEQDGNPADNTEEIPLTILNNPGRSSMVTLSASVPGAPPALVVTKTASVSETTAPGDVEYTIVVKNNGGEGYNGELFDTLYNEAGDVINEQAWDLGTIKAGESITVTYTMQFADTTKAGIYTNEAQVFADLAPTPASGGGTGDAGAPEQPFVESNISSSDVAVKSSNEESILPEACLTHITSYLKYGKKNDPEQVKKLQSFLNDVEGFGGVKVTGEFDMPTLQAVYGFQQKYADDVLTPWGIEKPTGYVYYTTQKKINEIYCKTNYDLSPEQLEEINKFKSRVERSQAEATPMPPTGDVGAVEVVPVIAKEPEPEMVEVVSALTAQAAGAGESASSSITKWIKGSLSSLKSRLGSWDSMRNLFNFRD